MPSQDDYQVKLTAFEGPLDLLLYLIRRAEVDINDIPIHTLTEQYLHFLKQIDRVDVELAGEFLVMAATLIEIKSRTLAPREAGAPGEELPAGEITDPRHELIQQLIAYQKYRSAAEDLEKLRRDRAARHEASGRASPIMGGPDAGTDPDGDAGGDDEGADPADLEEIDIEDAHILDLLGAYERIIAAVDFTRLGEHRVEYDDTPISLHEEDIVDQLGRAPERALTLQQMFVGRKRGEMIGLFLALLELARTQRIRVVQEKPGDPIQLALNEAAPSPAPVAPESPRG